MHCNHSHVLDGSDDIWVVMLVAWAGSLCTGGELLDRDETVSSQHRILVAGVELLKKLGVVVLEVLNERCCTCSAVAARVHPVGKGRAHTLGQLLCAVVNLRSRERESNSAS